jgi:hypothetical protein
MCFSYFYRTEQSKVGSKPSSSFNRASTTKSGSTRSSLTQPSFEDRSEIFTLRIEGEILASPKLKEFSLNDPKAATKNFRLDNLIGKDDSAMFTKAGLMSKLLLLQSEDIWYGCCDQEAKTRRFLGPKGMDGT